MTQQAKNKNAKRAFLIFKGTHSLSCHHTRQFFIIALVFFFFFLSGVFLFVSEASGSYWSAVRMMNIIMLNAFHLISLGSGFLPLLSFRSFFRFFFFSFSFALGLAAECSAVRNRDGSFYCSHHSHGEFFSFNYHWRAGGSFFLSFALFPFFFFSFS